MCAKPFGRDVAKCFTITRNVSVIMCAGVRMGFFSVRTVSACVVIYAGTHSPHSFILYPLKHAIAMNTLVRMLHAPSAPRGSSESELVLAVRIGVPGVRLGGRGRGIRWPRTIFETRIVVPERQNHLSVANDNTR